MDRLIAPNEAAVVRWLLNHAAVGDVTVYRTQGIEDMRVSKWCDCGCSSLSFDPDLKGAGMIADAAAVYPDGQKAGLVLFGREGKLVLLEVYDMDPDASHRVLDIANLRA